MNNLLQLTYDIHRGKTESRYVIIENLQYRVYKAKVYAFISTLIVMQNKKGLESRKGQLRKWMIY